MSPRRQSPSLQVLCMKHLSNLLIQALSDEEGKDFDEVRKYMSSGTSETLQALLNDILGVLNLDASTRYSCLEILLREDIKSLEVGIFPRFYYDKILVTIREQGKWLQHLNLKGVWARDFPQLLSSLIIKLHNLKSLSMPHMADDIVITSLSRLKSLTKLDISGEACYTTYGIRCLRSDSLRFLDIGSFGKAELCPDLGLGYELVAEIIENLPNLNMLKTYSFTGHALLQLLKRNPNFRSKLTYIHDTKTDLEVLEAIVKTCPLLESAHINCPDVGVVARLGELKRMHSLKLTKGDANEFIKFLQSSGPNLQLLQINQRKKYSLDLSDVCQYAPNLTRLECYQMNLRFTNPNSFFMNLQKIQILYCDISDEVVKTVMTNSPFLKSFNVGSALELTDGDMFRLLGECSLENLEELVFSEARYLTVITVELLAENCPKLKVLGTLTGWDIHKDELYALRILLSLSNLDLTLWSS